MEKIDEVKQAEAHLKQAEAELKKAESEEQAALKHIEEAVEEIKEAELAVTILVNGEPHEEIKIRISFEELVKLAYPVPPSGTCIEFTVTYRNGPSENPKGTLTAGHSVKIENRMIFDVTPTDRS
jgi:5-formyltetrahydrofolate cyclo-ligase